MYLNYFSFCDSRYKIGLIKCLFDRARKLCTPDKLASEYELLRNCLISNDYPDWFIDRYSHPTTKLLTEGPEKKKVLLTIPYPGEDTLIYVKKRLTETINKAYPVAQLVILTKSKKCLSPPIKSPTTFLCRSNVIYEFSCACRARYIGKTERRLGVRIGEHTPSWLLKGKARPKSIPSSITRHLVDCTEIQNTDPRSLFKVKFQIPTSFRLSIAEAILIHREKPDLCVHQKFDYSLVLPW